jgi:phosphate transport system substrate-binding protein
MTPAEIGRVAEGVQLLPLTAGTIVLTYNVPGVKELKLSREAYAGIFLGKVKKWNDPAIVKTNPGVNLPGSVINVVVRADSSGTTFVFTQHLSAISKEFAASPGRGMKALPPASRPHQGPLATSNTVTR